MGLFPVAEAHGPRPVLHAFLGGDPLDGLGRRDPRSLSEGLGPTLPSWGPGPTAAGRMGAHVTSRRVERSQPCRAPRRALRSPPQGWALARVGAAGRRVSAQCPELPRPPAVRGSPGSPARF